jgi:hypothetical protein
MATSAVLRAGSERFQRTAKTEHRFSAAQCGHCRGAEIADHAVQTTEQLSQSVELSAGGR